MAGQTILQTVLPCTTQLILTKDFIKRFCKTLLTKKFTMSKQALEKVDNCSWCREPLIENHRGDPLSYMKRL